MKIKSSFVLLAVIYFSLLSIVFGELLFEENYPDANSLSAPSSGSVKVVGMSVSLSLSGTTDSLIWDDGVDDGIAGPASGGVLKSGHRTSGGAWVYLVYQVDAPVGKALSDTSATLTAHTYGSAGYDVKLESSKDGINWEYLSEAHTAGFGDTDTATSDQAGDSNYQGISRVYYRISMPTFLSPTTSWHSVLDDIAISGTLADVNGPVVLFQEIYPDANSLVSPSSGSAATGIDANLSLDGTVGSLIWSDGAGDGIAGPNSGGTIKSSYRTSGTDAYVYLVYQIDAVPGELISDTSATITAHTYNSAGYKVKLESSTDGVSWENLAEDYSAGFSDTVVITTDQTGDADYQDISSVFYRISMPTFSGPTTSFHSVVDDITIMGTIPKLYTLTMQTSPEEPNFVIDPAVGQSAYSENSLVSISAEDFVDCPSVYRFDHWSGDVVDSNSPETTVTMHSDKVVTAVFVDARQCGDLCHPYPQGDLDFDCRVDFSDLEIFSFSWLDCTDPNCF